MGAIAETDADFERIAEVEADERSRIALGRAGVRRKDRYLVFKNEGTGEIRMIPMASVPAREMIIWENDELRTSLLQGLADSSAGRISYRDDYLEDDDE
ncbi:hypothetical protein [Saccharopolyspora gregorii]|uniref:SpoVT-AbrB domain-containing protein n=1 Tax=Saccharopolyspora gregorii TaxID=33914 RepID=A0ABP6RS07_9PSEU